MRSDKNLKSQVRPGSFKLAHFTCSQFCYFRSGQVRFSGQGRLVQARSGQTRSDKVIGGKVKKRPGQVQSRQVRSSQGELWLISGQSIPFQNNHALKLENIKTFEFLWHFDPWKNIPHFDVTDNVTYTAEDFYPLFEDLLIVGGSKCVALGIGSFGAFGAALAGNRCRALHRRPNGDILKCPNNRTNVEYIGILSDLMLEDNRNSRVILN